MVALAQTAVAAMEEKPQEGKKKEELQELDEDKDLGGRKSNSNNEAHGNENKKDKDSPMPSNGHAKEEKIEIKDDSDDDDDGDHDEDEEAAAELLTKIFRSYPAAEKPLVRRCGKVHWLCKWIDDRKMTAEEMAEFNPFPDPISPTQPIITFKNCSANNLAVLLDLASYCVFYDTKLWNTYDRAEKEQKKKGGMKMPIHIVRALVATLQAREGLLKFDPLFDLAEKEEKHRERRTTLLYFVQMLRNNERG